MRYFSPDRDISSFKRYFHCIMRAERSARDFRRRNKPRHKQIAIIRRFYPNLCVIPLPIEIFRRLNEIFTALCVQNVVHDWSAASKQAHTHANRNHWSILTKIKRYFSPVPDISTFEHTPHSNMHAERSARVFQRRNKNQTHKNSNNSSILTTIMRYFSPVWDIS